MSYALDLFHRRHLRAPRAKEWQRASDDNPSCRTIQARYGSWNAFLEACGYRSRRPGGQPGHHCYSSQCTRTGKFTASRCLPL
jgi:Homing endonuclease associated repeat